MTARREPVQLPTIVALECDWCGNAIPSGRKYCCPDCRTRYNNQCAAEGKQIVQAAKLWAKHRGAAGTNGAGMLQLIRDRADDFNRAARLRKETFRHDLQ